MRVLMAAVGAALAAAPALAQCGPPDNPAPRVRDSLLVSSTWLSRHLNDRNLVILHVGDLASYDAGHVPGARLVDAHEFSVGNHDLPAPARLDSAIERLGIGNDSRVVMYGDAWMTGWMYLVFDFMGHGDRTAILDGGLPAWREGGHAVSRQPSPPARRSTFSPRVRHDIVVSADWIRARLRHDDVALIDTRDANEYREGHLPGAVLLAWERTMARPREALQNIASPFLPVSDLQPLLAAAGVTGNRTPVLYCTVGMRASHMYFVARYLGHDPKIYDGSWADWTSRAGAVVRGTSPR